MDDKDTNVEGQDLQSPETSTSPEVDDLQPSSTDEVDKDTSEWARNKGYSDDSLRNPDVLKAIKMAKNAESFVGKRGEKQEELESLDDLDKYLDDILSEKSTTQKISNTQSQPGIDLSNMSSQERAVFDMLRNEAKKAALEEIGPIQSELQKQRIRGDYDRLAKEYGDDFVHNSKEILVKMRDNPNISLDDAAKTVLIDKLLKRRTSEGIEKGRQLKTDEIKQQTEVAKRTNVERLTMDKFKDLSSSEMEAVIKELAK